MIAKIMSEASHSIIGMLSAKPSDMETRTANNEFSSLMVPGEDRSRLAVEDSAADMADDTRGEQFLEQFIDIEAKTAPATSGPDIPKTMTLKNSADGSLGDTELPSDNSSSSSIAASETDRFISHALPATKLGDVAKVASIPLVFVDGPTPNNGVTPAGDADQKPAMGNGIQNMPAAAAKGNPKLSDDLNPASAENRLSVESKSPAAFKPQIEGKPQDKALGIDMMVQSPSEKVAADIVQRDLRTNAQITATIGSDAEAPVALSALQATGTERKMENLVDRRLANKARVETSASPQLPEIETAESTFVAEKPIKAETKSPIVELADLSATTPLDGNVETVVPANSTTVTGGQTATQKTVSFDWNTPQFAERFASEIGDLRINGDLKKFEINPRNMGRLEISLVAQGANEIIQIEAESDAARDVIAQHSQAIQDMLKAQGRADLILRIDVKENLLAGSSNQNMNFEQQDSADAQQQGSAPPQNYGNSMASRSEAGPPVSGDNSRYA